MSQNQELIQKLKNLLPQKRGISYYAKRLSISEEHVRELIQQIKSPKIETSRKVNVDKGTIESVAVVSFEPKSHAELAKLHKIDESQYVIRNYWTKLLPNGKFTSSVFATLKTPEDFSIEDVERILSGYKPTYISKEKKFNPNTEIIDVEISLSDFHLAKRCIDVDNDPISRKQRYFDVAKQLIEEASACHRVNTVVFPISNDFFHTDTYYNTTTNGTPQDVILDYAEEYELGFSLLVDTIKMLQQYCNNVIVLLVQGNHDKTKSYYLAHALEVYFRNDFSVTFDRSKSPVKGVMLGNTFIGYHHGNCKIEDLPLLFATHPEYASMFGEAKYREVHTGDKHHYMAKEVKGVRIQQIPSLSGTDKWHMDNNYVHSIKAALAFGYHKEKGKKFEFEERI